MGGHYDAVADDYEAACFYDPGSDYHAWLTGRTLARLAPRAGERLVDIGGGAGGFALGLRAACDDDLDVLIVEPSAGLGSQAAERPGLRLRQDDALAYALDPAEAPVERVLMKEVVHHLDLARLAELYQGLFAKLRPGGRLLTITRPVEPSYPLFEAARAVWRAHQPPVEVFAEAQRAAGLKVSIEVERYPLELTADAWFGMIRGRCWSTFSNFDDAALEAGIAEVARDYPEPVLRFADELLFVVADRGA